MENKKKRTLKAVGLVALFLLLVSGTTVMASTMLLKWTGAEVTAKADAYIEKSAQKLIELEAQLEDALSNNNSSSEMINELQRQIVLLNEEVQKANVGAKRLEDKLQWAMDLLKANGIVLELE